MQTKKLQSMMAVEPQLATIRSEPVFDKTLVHSVGQRYFHFVITVAHVMPWMTE